MSFSVEEPESWTGTTNTPGVSTPASSMDANSMHEDIAVIGMACRLPGDNNSPEKLWESVMNKRVAAGEIPALRWQYYRGRDAETDKLLDETTKHGYFVNDIEAFDSQFFGISPKEAVLMDPQQRITLEVVWEALEDAGIVPSNLAASNTACFVGVNSDDYGKMILDDLPAVQAWMGIGAAYCGIPNRVSYLLDLRGPSTAVDAACASSLVAVHHGRQSLLARETDLAIVGGVNAICGPGMIRVLDEAGAISKDGVCRSFDEEANGYGRGEGAAVIILKRARDAYRDGDRILAVLKGSAVGQDGRTNGIMAPKGEAQEQVARSALGSLHPSSVQYVEAHATSTKVDDPVEIGAMSNLYGAGARAQNPCFIGSVKANVGHLEAGAGAVGFMKAVLALRNGMIPPQANLKKLNQKINWKDAGLKVAIEPTAWPLTFGPKRAAICSYGYGGSVSHAVIEEATEIAFPVVPQPYSLPATILLSAPQKKRLSAVAKDLKTWLEGKGSTKSLQAICHTLACRRQQHDFRAGFRAATHADAIRLLGKIAGNTADRSIFQSRAPGKAVPKTVWLFSGHGSQWPRMGRELIEHEPIFKNAVTELEQTVNDEAGFSLLQALSHGSEYASDQVQILTFAMQIGLTAIMRSICGKPDAIIGHSVGEIAAAVAAGCLTPVDGARVVCRRAVLYRKVIGTGSMSLVRIAYADAADLLQGRTDIWAAIDSSSTSCVVAGTPQAMESFKQECSYKEIESFQVKSDIAFHTDMLQSLAEPVKTSLRSIPSKPPHTNLYSTTTADPREQKYRNGEYWALNMVSPVRLTGAVKAALDDGHEVFLEISGHPIIANSVNETIESTGFENAAALPTLLRNKSTRESLSNALASLWSRGAKVDWNKFYRGSCWEADVPRTQWQHQSFWPELKPRQQASSKTHDVSEHVLLGQEIPIAGENRSVFTTQLDEASRPFPGSHPLHGTEIVPAAVLFNTFLKATQSSTLCNVHLKVPVAISAKRHIQVISDQSGVRLASRLVQEGELNDSEQNDSWLTHTTGALPPAAEVHDQEPCNLTELFSRIQDQLPTSFSTKYLADVGVPDMGFPWAITKHHGNTREMLATVDACPAATSMADVPWDCSSWAPIVDAATSIASTIFHEVPRLRMPSRVDKVSVTNNARPTKIANILVRRVEHATELGADIWICDESGNVLIKFDNMQFSEIEGNPAKHTVDSLLHQIFWRPAKLQDTPYTVSEVVLISYEHHPLFETYLKQLQHRPVLVRTCTVEALAKTTANLRGQETAVVFLAPSSSDDIFESTHRVAMDLLKVVKTLSDQQSSARLFAVTTGAIDGFDLEAVGQSGLVGLSRIIASEVPEIWGGLIDVDSDQFPMQVLKYLPPTDVVRIDDCVVQVGRLRPVPIPNGSTNKFTVHANGTYVITGGLGVLGLTMATHLVSFGARRLVLISRRGLPHRHTWSSQSGNIRNAIDTILALEALGATIHVLKVDICAPKAAALLRSYPFTDLPPVRGIIHAAGVLEDQLVLETTPDAFANVISPKIRGALALHEAFPPTSPNLDFFAMFSSCGQLLGFPGQASYAAGNSFLDSLVEHRRRLGDKGACSLQWTSWRGVGGMGDNELVEAELEGRGVGSISKEEALKVWDEVGRRGVGSITVLPVRMLEAGEECPLAVLEDVVRWKEGAPSQMSLSGETGAASVSTDATTKTGTAALPPPGPERLAYLEYAIAECVAATLQLPGPEDVDSKTALSDLGMDSVMTVALRKRMQDRLGVKVPPTLIWGHPTVSHLVKWFDGKLG